jgi:hypothetical protein
MKERKPLSYSSLGALMLELPSPFPLPPFNRIATTVLLLHVGRLSNLLFSRENIFILFTLSSNLLK